MKHSTSVCIHIRKAKHTPKSTSLVVFKALCTLDLKPGVTAKWSNCAKIHALCWGNKFSWHKTLTCPECAQFSLVYFSVPGPCAEQLLLHYSVAFCSPYIFAKKKTQNTVKYDVFSVLSVHVWRTRSTKIRFSVSQQYSMWRIMYKEGRFHDTTVLLVQNVHRFASYPLGQVILHSSAYTAQKRKTWLKARFLCYLRLCRKDLEPRRAAPWSNCRQSHALSTNDEV